MSRRILHIVDSLHRTGVARQLFVLADGLARQGWDVHIAALEGGGAMTAEFRAAGLSTAEFDRRWWYDPIAYNRLRRLVDRLRPDTIHTWGDSARIYGGLASRPTNRTRLLVGQYGIARPSMIDRLVGRRLSNAVERFVVNSAVLRDWCENRGLPTDKVAVIPPGVPPAPASDVSRAALLRELDLPANAKLIGVVGRLVPEKRVKDLIWAADLLRVLHDNLRLLVIGDGPLRPQLEQYARLASDLDHIRFLGERADVWRIMPHLDVLWNAAENGGPSIAILEAMAAGVPVVASDTAFNRELVVENETGYLIPLGERAGRAARARHTDRILTDAELATCLAAASRQRVADHFDRDELVQRHVNMYLQKT